MATGAVLAVDSGSPEISVAVAVDRALLALRTAPQKRASAELLRLVDEALTDAGLSLSDLAGIVVLRGPGSFTGLRVGMATVLGMHQALGIPSTAVPTLEALAGSVPPGPRTLSLVHALRLEWYGQLFAGDPLRPASEPQRLEVHRHVEQLAPERCVGFGLESLSEDPAVAGLPLLSPMHPLAAVAALRASHEAPAWDPDLLTRPLYLSPPAASTPGAPKPVIPHASRG